MYNLYLFHTFSFLSVLCLTLQCKRLSVLLPIINWQIDMVGIMVAVGWYWSLSYWWLGEVSVRWDELTKQHVAAVACRRDTVCHYRALSFLSQSHLTSIVACSTTTQNGSLLPPPMRTLCNCRLSVYQSFCRPYFYVQDYCKSNQPILVKLGVI